MVQTLYAYYVNNAGKSVYNMQCVFGHQNDSTVDDVKGSGLPGCTFTCCLTIITILYLTTAHHGSFPTDAVQGIS